jgi:hypothetical protein
MLVRFQEGVLQVILSKIVYKIAGRSDTFIELGDSSV